MSFRGRICLTATIQSDFRLVKISKYYIILIAFP
jgi:hypothetical protein